MNDNKIKLSIIKFNFIIQLKTDDSCLIKYICLRNVYCIYETNLYAVMTFNNHTFFKERREMYMSGSWVLMERGKEEHISPPPRLIKLNLT